MAGLDFTSEQSESLGKHAQVELVAKVEALDASAGYAAKTRCSRQLAVRRS
jgi:hypothetical protein